MNQEYMKTRKILPLVLSMSLPMVISMAVNALYNIVDSYFVAKISEDAMTALALVFPVQNLVNAIVIGFAIGINARVAFYLGAKEEKLADESASVGLLLNLIHGLVLALLCSAIMPSFLRMFTGDTQVIALACTYSTRVFAFAPVIGLELAYEKIFQAVGRMKVSMICMMLGCVTNIILDPVMIFGLGPVPKLGIAGAAYATGIGQCVTLAGYLLFYFARPMHVKVNVANMKTTGSVMKNIYTIGIPATLNLALPSIQVSALNAILAPFPGSYILVLGVYYKLQTFIYLTANGIVQGIRPLVGYNYGAGEYDRVKKIAHLHGIDRTGYGYGNGNFLCNSAAADGIVYHKPRNNGNRRCGTQNHQFWIRGILGFRYIFRSPGGTGKGHAITFDFSCALYRCDAAGFFCAQPVVTGIGCVVRICRYRVYRSGSFLLYIQIPYERYKRVTK